MRAFVTGGSGFLGRNLLAMLREQGAEVRALARSPRAVATVQEAGAQVVLGDMEDRKAMERAMAGCDVVFHVAALAQDWGSYDEFYRSNVLGTQRVIGATRAAGVPRLVHVSTESVLLGAGAPRLVNADETWPRVRKPLGLYPLTKGLAEERVLAANSPRLATIIMRPRMIWGAGDTSLMPAIIEAVNDGQFVWINGGHHLTSTCHVRNVCEGLILGAQQGVGGEIYFLTDGEPTELRSFLTRLLKTQGVVPGNRSIPYWLAYAAGSALELAWRRLPLKGAPPITRYVVRLLGEEVTVSDAKARRELGYQGSVSREEGLREMERAAVAV